MTVSTTEKRIQKVSGKALSSFSVLPAYAVIPFRAFKTTIKLLRSIIAVFFVLQFGKKWGFLKIPVVHVDHPLDKKIPFLPRKVDIYLSFINLWICPMTMLIRRYGAGKAIPFIREWLELLKATYDEAGRLYRFRLTTMERPSYHKGHFFTIHFFDPHLLCVPSLHIAIIALCYSFYHMLFEREEFTQAEKNQWNNELYKQSVAIAESVLYVKQHSVNCVPAALYMISRIFPDLYKTEDAVHFIKDMFVAPEEMSAESAGQVREHLLFVYERFLLEGAHEDDWRAPVQRWLVEYNASAQADQ